MAGCNSENTARQAPLQRNNDEGVFCHDADCLSHASWLNGDEVAKNEKNTSTTDEKHIVDTATQSAFINEKTDSLLEASPVIKPPAIKIPPPGMMKPLIDIKQRQKYGVEVSDSDYRFKVKPKE